MLARVVLGDIDNNKVRSLTINLDFWGKDLYIIEIQWDKQDL